MSDLPRVNFSRIVTPRFTKDVDELRTYNLDIRKVLSDNAIMDGVFDNVCEDDGTLYLEGVIHRKGLL